MNNTVIQSTSATSGTVTTQDTKQDIVIVHTGALTATLTIAFPATPVDGQCVLMVTENGITLLTLSAAVGTIISAITSLAVGVPASYLYSAANTKWYRIR